MTVPVASFGPEMIEFFKQASQKKITVTLGSEREARRMRYRLYELRKAMRKEDHYMRRAADKVSLHIRKGSPVLTARPADQTFIEALRKAGVSITEEELKEAEHEEAKQPPAIEASEEGTQMEKLLKNLEE